MKKLLLIFICILMSVLLSSCSKQTSLDKTKEINDLISNQITQEQSTSDNEPDNDIKLAEPLDDGSGIERVIISCLNEKSESAYDRDAKEFLKEIEDCTDEPENLLINKIGLISIKYKDSDDTTDFAELYVDAQYNMYAKLISQSNTDYAYKIDAEKIKK